MEIHPIAFFESPLKSKFGIPRQSGLVSGLTGRIVFEPEYRKMEAVRGLEDFSHLWIIWEFSQNTPASNHHSPQSLTVRPPRLGGNVRMGVFATRSPFRPNSLGLSCVRIDHIEQHPTLGPVIHVLGGAAEGDDSRGTGSEDSFRLSRSTESHTGAGSASTLS